MAVDDVELTPEDRVAIRAAMAEVDPRQMEINRRLTPAQRVAKGLSMTQTALHVVIYRLRLQRPELSEAEAQSIVLAKYYAAEHEYVRR